MVRFLPSCDIILNMYFLTSPFHTVCEGYSRSVVIFIYMVCKVDPHSSKCLSIFVFNKASVGLKTLEDLALVISIVTARLYYFSLVAVC